MKNRREFLKTACKPVVLATLGIPVIEACSSEDDSQEIIRTNENQPIIRIFVTLHKFKNCMLQIITLT